jgi:hypothetical protein
MGAIVGISRSQLWAYLDGATPVIAPLLIASYEREEEIRWRTEEKSPHGHGWSTSFHASAFPGDEEACGRLAVYGLMGLPRASPFPPFVRAMLDHGLDIEHHFVSRLDSYGSLLTANVAANDDFQTGFEDEEHWLSGNTDGVVLPRGWRKGFVLEVKTCAHEKVMAMRSRTPSFIPKHPQYVRQLKTYIGLAHELPFTPTVNLCNETGAIVPVGGICPDHGKRCAFTSTTLLPPDDGALVYSSREEPLTVAEFRYHYDPQFMAAGRARLAEWREDFFAGRIPEHPYEGRGKMWTESLCKYCDLKKMGCKQDYTGGTTRLEESAVIEFARGVRPDYDYPRERAAAFRRWEEHDPLTDASLIGSSSNREE